MKATIFNIQKFCSHDGPGIRTTVFFKGCNLACKWCHNPESQSSKRELFFYKSKCNNCGRCKSSDFDNKGFVCFNGAREVCGNEYSIDEILNEVLKDYSYYKNSGGGVTFSGGECMLQIDFLLEILKKCKENSIHTAIDTAGNVAWEYFEKVMPYTDLFLYDVKIMDAKEHKLYTGVSNELILENLSKLLNSGACVWVRIPLVPLVNDSVEEMKKIKEFLDKYSPPAKIELLPYHTLGIQKYEALGREVNVFSCPDKAEIEKLYKVFY